LLTIINSLTEESTRLKNTVRPSRAALRPEPTRPSPASFILAAAARSANDDVFDQPRRTDHWRSRDLGGRISSSLAIRGPKGREDGLGVHDQARREDDEESL
jgi:hypothetical protein